MTSAHFAQLFGLLYLLLGLGIIINPKYYQKAYASMLENTGIMYLLSIIILVVGFFMTTFHNEWVKDWPVIITIIGWGALLKGFFAFLAPEEFKKVGEKSLKNLSKKAWVIVVLGILLCYFGFAG